MEQLYDQIEAYLEGKLSPEEKAAFESRLREDAALRSEVESYKTAKAAIRDAGRRDLRSAVDEAYYDWEKRPSQRRSIRRPLAIAAAVLLLIAAVFVIRNFLSTASPQELYAANFELPPAPALRSESPEAAWNTIVAAYRQGDYDKVVSDLPDLLADPAFDRPAQGYFYLGISQLMLDQPEAAIESFQQVSTTSALDQEQSWYLALAYLRVGQINQAEKQLRDIAGQSGHYKHTEARHLLARL